MTDGQADRTPAEPGWSQHAETGGWPPPDPAQRRYEPGLPEPTPGASAPWAPGDQAYGRLGGVAGPTPPPGTPPPPSPPPGTPPRAPRPRRPVSTGTPVTIALIVACVLGFLIQQADPEVTYRYGLLPVAVETGQYERIITAAFLHAGLLHLAVNMFTLYIVGTPLERVLGAGRYLTIYLLSAVGGSLLSLWLSPAWTVGVGASGAIYGLFGALVVLRKQIGADARGLAVLIGLNLVITFAVPNVSWQAHIGGLVTGVLVALVIAAVARARRTVT